MAQYNVHLRSDSRPLLALLLLCFLTLFLGLGAPAITDSDEAFYAEAAREMVESGDWLTPHFNYEYRWQKPVLYYWLTAATYLVTGPSEFAARFWSALSGVGLVLITWSAARRLDLAAAGSGSRDAPGRRAGIVEQSRRGTDVAWLAGAIVATCYGYFAEARLALPDLPLTFFITLGVWAALRASTDDGGLRWWAIGGAAAGFGFLMKGPVALVIPGIILIPIWIRERRRVSLPPSGLLVAVALFAAIGLPWYVAMWLQHGAAYLESFFLGDNLERFATARFNEPRPVWYYVPIIIGGLIPWSAYLVIVPWPGLRDVIRRLRPLENVEWRLLLWAAVPFLFYTASIGKQPRYVLPVLPPLAILLARSMIARLHAPAAAAHRPIAIATWVTALLYVLLAGLLLRAQPLFGSPRLAWVGVLSILLAAAAIAYVGYTRAWTRLPRVMAAAAATLLVAIQYCVLAGHGRPEAVEQMASLVRQHRTAGEPVGEYQVFVRNLVFYTGFRQTELYDEAPALEFVRSPERILLVARPGDVAMLQERTGVALRTLGQVEYMNTANIRLRTLLWPDPSRDRDTVLLVTNR